MSYNQDTKSILTPSGQTAEPENTDRLSSLVPGETAEIKGISKWCQGLQRRRLMDLGIVPGKQITAMIRSASGDPTGYRIMGTTIGIRKSQADLILIGDKRKEDDGSTL